MIEQRYEKRDMEYISTQWADELKAALDRIPEDWMMKPFSNLMQTDKDEVQGKS